MPIFLKKTNKNRGIPKSTADMPGKRMGYFVKRRGLDTLVFIHGFGFGHFTNTWGKFPTLLHHDPDLPSVDILLWGYETGLFVGKDVSEESLRLISDLEVLSDSQNNHLFAAHSMGGLLLLDAFRSAMVNGRAEDHPCRNTMLISLFASPLTGKWVASLVRRSPLRWLMSKQFRNLTRGNFCDSLISDVFERIYRPNIEDRSAKKIKIRVNVAMKDRLVSKPDCVATLARFKEPAPRVFDEGHASVKLPDDRADVRYLSFAGDVQDALATAFRARAEDLLRATGNLDTSVEFNDLYRRYGSLCVLRAKDFLDSTNEVTVKRLLRLALKDAAESGRPPFDCLNRAAIVLSERV